MKLYDKTQQIYSDPIFCQNGKCVFVSHDYKVDITQRTERNTERKHLAAPSGKLFFTFHVRYLCACVLNRNDIGHEPRKSTTKYYRRYYMKLC